MNKIHVMKNIVIGLLLAIGLISCSEKKNSGNTNVSSDSIQLTFQSLRDTANTVWIDMIKSDDQKIADMERLLLEISYCSKYNAMRQDSIAAAVKNLKSIRYQQFTMTSEQIDQYDDMTNKVIMALKSHALTTKELESHPLGQTLFNDIASADNKVSQYRALYDRFAFQYNDLIEKHKDKIKSSEELKKLPVFSIIVPVQ